MKNKYYLTNEDLEHHFCLNSLPKPIFTRLGSLRSCICGDIWRLRGTVKNDSWTGRKKYWIRTTLESKY